MGFISKVQKLGQGISEALEIEAALGSKAMPLREFLMGVLDCLEKIPHVLVGGFALAEYAKPRATQDLDFVIVTHDMDTIIRHFEEKGFKKIENLPYSKPKRDIVKFEYQGRECDLLFFSSHDFTQALFKRARTSSLFGKKIKIASAEDLVVTKLASLRWKDKADIMAMRLKSDTLDLSYIRERLWDLGISDRIEFLKLPVEE